MPENILIDFEVDTSGLAPAIDQLEALGKVDKESASIFRQGNAELTKRAQVTKLTSEEFKKTGLTLEQLAAKMRKGTDETKKFTDVEKQLRAELEKIKNQLKLSNEEFDKLKNGATKTAEAHKSLRQELRQITEQLTKLKLEGKDNSAQYLQLAATAAKYRDALGDVSQEINRAASDTRKLDTMIEFATGVAGAFSIAQGAAGLFGDKSEELQEVLLRVQSAMAVLNGLQSIQNVLANKSNLIRAVTNTQLKLAVISTNLETAAQSKNIIVKGAATVAMRLLNAVMSANPAFLLIAAFAALAGALAFLSRKTKEAVIDNELLNATLEHQKFLLDKRLDNIERGGQIELALAKKRGASEKELQKLTEDILIRQNIAQRKSTQERIEDLKKIEGVSVRTINNINDAQIALLQLEQKVSKEGGFDKLDESSKARVTAVRTLLTEISSGFNSINKSQEALEQGRLNFAVDQGERDIENAKKTAEERKKIELQRLNDAKARIDSELLFEREGTLKFLELQVKRAEAEKNIGLFNAKSFDEKELILKQFLKNVDDLTTDFYANEDKKAIENQISILNAQLSNINISALEKERLTIELLERQKQLELAAVVGNKQKEKEINAKFDKEIADQAVAIRKAGLDEELALLTAQTAKRRREIERQTQGTDENDIPIDIKTRIKAIDDLLAYETNNISKRKELNDSLYKDGLISAKEFNFQNAMLIQDELMAVQNAEAAKRSAYKETNDRRLKNVLETARQTIDVLSTLYDFIAARENNALDTQRQRIKDLQDAGAISEKEAKERFKRLDVEERKNKQQAAQRNKAIEVFNSILAIPAAFLKGLKDGGYVLAAIYAGLAAAQAALIAAKPIPKFGKGKRNQYEGLGEVGEAGTELIEKGGKMYVADKPQIIWLSKSDKVYNPKETIDMINRPLPKIDKRIMNFNSTASNNMSIDYKKLGEAVGKSIPTHIVNIDEKGITYTVNEVNSYTEYLDKRRRF